VRGASYDIVVIDEAQDFDNTGEYRSVYADLYKEKVIGHVPDLDVDWYYECKAEEAPRYREPFTPAHKGRRGWNQPKPLHHMKQHRPRMNYRRRRRYG
jgi:hypothetical protein